MTTYSPVLLTALARGGGRVTAIEGGAAGEVAGQDIAGAVAIG